MKTILFFAESVSLAHIGRPLVLAEWAKEQGYNIHIATGPKGVAILQKNAPYIPITEIFSISGEDFYQRVNQGKFFYTPTELEQYVESEIELIKIIKPDFIVSDFRLTTAISARVMEVPLINLSNAYWSPFHDCQFQPPHIGFLNWMPENLKYKFFNLLRPIAFKTFGKPLNLLRKKYKLSHVNDFRTHYTAGDYTLYMDHPDFIKLDHLPFRHSFLGPVIWSPRSAKKITTTKKNCIYITMGSSGNNQVLLEIAKACVTIDRQLIFSGLCQVEAEKLFLAVPTLKQKSIVEPLMNPEEILKNCDLTICHGGSGTVYQSILANTPVLCFPHNPDQGLVAMAVKEGNYGSVITPSQANTNTILNRIQNLLNDETKRESVKNFNLKICNNYTKNRWVDFLSEISSVTQNHLVIDGAR